MTRFARGAVLNASNSTRTITGIVVPYGPVGRTSMGDMRVAAGSIRLPQDLARIKLLGGGHDWETPVGYCVRAAEHAYGLEMEFKIATTDAGDKALLEASQRIRDAFSVELDRITRDGDLVTGADLVAVAQLAVPAFADARVSSVAAQRNQGDDMGETHPETEPDTGTENEPDTGTENEPDTGTETEPEQPAKAAARPVGLQAGAAPTVQPKRSLSTLYAALSRKATDGRLTPEMEAALYDVTHTANAWVQPTQFENQLWSGVAYSRQIVPLLTMRNLTSYNVTGWRWKTKPFMDDYAGDKAEVPTNPAETEAASTTAQRLAGAHDIDRKFFDFGDTGFFQAYYEAMAESWALKTDEIAAAFLIAQATPVPDADVDNLIDAVDIGADNVEMNTNAQATFALVSGADWRRMVSTKASDVPAFLDLMGIQPDNFIRSRFVPAGTVIVGARQAVSWYERAGSPIRVQTVDLAHGGIDGGLFGYYATLLNDAGGLVSVGVTQPAPEVPADF